MGLSEPGILTSRLLLLRRPPPLGRDDWGRTALHWAAFLGLTDVAQLLLSQADAYAEAERAREPDAPAIPKLTEFQVRFWRDVVLGGVRRRRAGVVAGPARVEL